MPDLSFDYDRYRVEPGRRVHLDRFDPADTQGLSDKEAAREQVAENRRRLAALQEKLYAEDRQALLLVLQGMDTSGKDSTIRKVTQGVNPQGVRVASFKVPSARERAHDFLWRVHQEVPERGMIRIFNRSHYEDVLVVRVHGLAPEALIERRYGHINDFERMLSDHGTRIVKVMLHISPAFQLKRLRRRLEHPDKLWKFNPGDLEERKRWDDYQRAYELALSHCSTDYAPWYVVPAERRWFRDLVVSQLLVDTLAAMDPAYPAPSFDPADFPPESLQ